MHQFSVMEQRVRRKMSPSIRALVDGLTRAYAAVRNAVGELLRTLAEAYAQPGIAALAADGHTQPRSRTMVDAVAHLLARRQPLFCRAQRQALRLRDRQRRAESSTVPAALPSGHHHRRGHDPPTTRPTTWAPVAVAGVDHGAG